MKQQILDAAVTEAEAVGWSAMTRDGVARRAGVATGLVNHYFGTVAKLRDEVMREAIRTERLALLLQGVAAQNPVASEAPAALKQRALHAAA